MTAPLDSSETTYRYEVTEGDLIRYHTTFLMASQSTKRTLRMGQVAVGVTGLIVLGLGMGLSSPSLVFMVAMLTSVVGCVILYPRFFERAARKRIIKLLRANPPENTFGEHTLTLTPAGLQKEGPSHGGLVAWGRIRGVSTNPAYVAFHLDERAVEIIPAATFMGSAGLAAFISEVERYVEASQTKDSDAD